MKSSSRKIIQLASWSGKLSNFRPESETPRLVKICYFELIQITSRSESLRIPSSQLYLKIRYGLPAWGSRGVRTPRFTLVINRMPDKKEEIILFDRQNDPYELTNIAEGKPNLVLKLVEDELIPWLEKTKDPWLEKTRDIKYNKLPLVYDR